MPLIDRRSLYILFTLFTVFLMYSIDSVRDSKIRSQTNTNSLHNSGEFSKFSKINQNFINNYPPPAIESEEVSDEFEPTTILMETMNFKEAKIAQVHERLRLTKLMIEENWDERKRRDDARKKLKLEEKILEMRAAETAKRVLNEIQVKTGELMNPTWKKSFKKPQVQAKHPKLQPILERGKQLNKVPRNIVESVPLNHILDKPNLLPSEIPENRTISNNTPEYHYFCQDKPNGLKHLNPKAENLRSIQIPDIVNKLYPEVATKDYVDGEYIPSNGQQISSHAAILIPYRNREKHLMYFLHVLPKILIYQQIHFKIYVLNQADDLKFNRGSLFNMGIDLAKKDYDWDCYYFHDVDRVPHDYYIDYRCSNDPDKPVHLTQVRGELHNRSGRFGGISQVSAKLLLKMKGYSNFYWGWGGEDEDFASRVQLAGGKIIKQAHRDNPDSTGRISFMSCHHAVKNIIKDHFSKKEEICNERYLLFKYRDIRFAEGDGFGQTKFVKVEVDDNKGGHLVKWIDIWLAGETYHNENYLREIAEWEKKPKFQAYHDEDIDGFNGTSSIEGMRSP